MQVTYLDNSSNDIICVFRHFKSMIAYTITISFLEPSPIPPCTPLPHHLVFNLTHQHIISETLSNPPAWIPLPSHDFLQTFSDTPLLPLQTVPPCPSVCPHLSKPLQNINPKYSFLCSNEFTGMEMLRVYVMVTRPQRTLQYLQGSVLYTNLQNIM